MGWKRSWSEAELVRLRELVGQGLKPAAIAPLFGRSVLSVRDRIKYDRVLRGERRSAAINYVSAAAPCARALAARDARLEASYRRTLTQAFFGDPPPGWSALDKRQA